MRKIEHSRQSKMKFLSIQIEGKLTKAENSKHI